MQNQFYFLDFPETKRFFEICNNHGIQARFVGGCVRDGLLGLQTDDFDIAVNAPILDLVKILETSNVKCILSGVKYGSIMVILGNRKFDITSLRCDANCLGRACDIDFTDSFAEDAKRRDFTINALYVSENGELFDYFGGVDDLTHKRIIFIGDPFARISEDHLRILRYYRFCAKVGDKSYRYADILHNNAYLLKNLSIERIQKEVFQTINCGFAINMMYENNILQQISGSINIDLYNKLCDIQTTALVRLIALFGFDNTLAIFRFSKSEKKLIIDYKNFINETLDYCFYKKGQEFTQAIMTLRQVYGKKLPIFPLTYKDISKEVKNISSILSECEKQWVNNGFPNRRETLNLLKKFFIFL